MYSFIDVCSELIKRGHRVTFPTNEHFARSVREAGAEAIEFEFQMMRFPKALRQYPWCDSSSFWRMYASTFCPLTIGAAVAMVAELEEFYARNPPNVFVHEWFNLAGRILAKQLGRPAVQMSTNFAHHNSIVREDGVCTTPQPMLEFSPVLDTFMSMFGFEEKGQMWHVEPLNIFLIPKEFQYDVSLFDNRFKFVGATFSQRPSPTSWKNGAKKGEPLLLISEASTTVDDSFLKLCIEAFAESQYHVVFSKGSNSPEGSSKLLPNNFQVNRETFNREILPFSDVALCQGGMGTTLEFLYHGVPVVAVPSTPFNAEVAYRMAELGVGLSVPGRGVTPVVLKNAVDTAWMDKALRSRARRMQDNLRSKRGAELAADTIEEFLE
jgi:MGT family glycosyltransferase